MEVPNKLPVSGKPYALLLSFLFFFTATFSQTITGRVSDVEGKPLASVTITVKGTTNVTVSDASGNYSIHADGNATLVFSSVGFATLEVPDRKSVV